MATLDGVVVAVSGSHGKDYTQAKLEKLVKTNGGVFQKAVTDEVTHLITNTADVEKGSTKLKAAEEHGAAIVSLEWLLESIETGAKEDESAYSLVSKVAVNGTAPAVASKKRGAKAVDDEDEDEDEDEPPAKKSKPAKGTAKGKGKGKAKTKTPDEDEDEKDETPEPPAQMKTQRFTGKAPVDEMCSLKDSWHVYVDKSGLVYDACLNQTEIGANANKFYNCQLLENPGGNQYAVFCRWGRVGNSGQNKFYVGPGAPLQQAIYAFDKQFKAKTGKFWEQRAQAAGGAKKYAYLERNYEDSDDEGDVEGKKEEQGGPAPKIESKIAKPLQSLMQLIFNSQFVAESLAELQYDARKLPLGKLSKETILKGYSFLKDLADVIDNPTTATQNHGEYGNTMGSILQELSNRYYTLIPHVFGMRTPPIINNMQLLKKEKSLIENLSDMVITTKLMKQQTGTGETVHALDKQFESLGLDEATPLDRSSDEFKHLAAYLKKTHGHTHSVKLTVEDIFRVSKNLEEERWKADGWDQIKNDNRHLLWHGSRTTNFAGILSTSLRIAPPEAPVSGYMFDKGIYLADCVSKSANYCYANISGGTGLLLLCESQLGDPMLEMTGHDYNAATKCKLAGKLAVKGLGRTAPKSWEDGSVIHENLKGVKIPKVTGTEETIVGDVSGADAMKGNYLSLQYNEYIVYNVTQVKMRYLFKCKFGY